MIDYDCEEHPETIRFNLENYNGEMSKSLTLLTVHAHPDDESSKGAGTVAKLRNHGVRSILVTCTGGEEGDIHNPAMDRPEVRENMPAVRKAELDRAIEIIGYEKLYLLGYRDSGMPDTEANSHPESFGQASIEEAGDKLIEIIRAETPQVIVTYHEDQSGYPHPDHLRVHDISIYAFDRCGDPSYKPELGAVHEVSKLYYSAWSKGRVLSMHQRFLDLGMESPFSEERLARMGNDEQITTKIDVKGYYSVRKSALLAHATQIDPNSPMWFGLPDAEAEDAWPCEEYVLARSNIPGYKWDGEFETNLFGGIADDN